MELHGQDIHMDEARMDASKLIILVKIFSPHLEELLYKWFFGEQFLLLFQQNNFFWEFLGIFEV